MAVFDLVTIPAESLRERSKEVLVEEIQTPAFQRYLDDLEHTMLVKDGVGIASPQVGRNIRAIVVLMDGKPQSFINPVITKQSEAMMESDEGCLSVPNRYGIVMRHKRVQVEALNRHGRKVTLDLHHFPAIVFQHEIDHLNGVLFIDKLVRELKPHGKHI